MEQIFNGIWDTSLTGGANSSINYTGISMPLKGRAETLKNSMNPIIFNCSNISGLLNLCIKSGVEGLQYTNIL